jgi:hypothetical protein
MFYKKFIALVTTLSFLSTLNADPGSVENPLNPYYQYPSQYEGAKGPALASRAGFTQGITTAEIAAGMLVVTIFIIGAAILSNNSHAH